MQADWKRIDIAGLADIEARRIGGKVAMEPLFRSFAVPENSDFFPYLEHRAARARFRGLNAAGYKTIAAAGLPLVEMLEGRAFPYSETRVVERSRVDRAAGMRNAAAAYAYLVQKRVPEGMVPETRSYLAALSDFCGGGQLFGDREALVALAGLSSSTTPFLTRDESRQALLPLLSGSCIGRMGEEGKNMAKLIEKIIDRDGASMRLLGDKLLANLPEDANRSLLGLALDAAKLGAIVSGDPAHAQSLWVKYGKRVQTGTTIPMENRLLMSAAEVRMKGR